LDRFGRGRGRAECVSGAEHESENDSILQGCSNTGEPDLQGKWDEGRAYPGFPASSLRRMLNRPRIRRFLHRSLRLRTVRCGVAAIHAANSWHAEFSAAFRSNREPFFVRLDRKSTRLNSSHVKISYAVFCLK